MLDTDSDRCGFIVPNQEGSYEPLHRNKLIALLGVEIVSLLLNSLKPESQLPLAMFL